MFSNEAFVEGFRSNNANIIKQFYTSEWPKVLNIVVQYGGNEPMAKDIMQDAIVALYLNISQNRYTSTTEAKLSTYFIQICKNKLKDLLKSAHVRKVNSINTYSTLQLEDLVGVDEVHEIDPRIEMTINCMSSLGDQCQSILKQYYWEKLNLNTIAKVMNMTEESIKNAKYRCMKKLRELVAQKL